MTTLDLTPETFPSPETAPTFSEPATPVTISIKRVREFATGVSRWRVVQGWTDDTAWHAYLTFMLGHKGHASPASFMRTYRMTSPGGMTFLSGCGLDILDYGMFDGNGSGDARREFEEYARKFFNLRVSFSVTYDTSVRSPR